MRLAQFIIDVAALHDHAEKILLAIAEERRPDLAPAVTEAARDQATSRFADLSSLNQLISESRALRASVITLWTDRMGAADHSVLGELTRFTAEIDQALAASIATFASRVEHTAAACIAKSPNVTEAQLRWSREVIDRQVRHMAKMNGYESIRAADAPGDTGMNSATSTVFLVDDDRSVVESLRRLLTARGFTVLAWTSPDAFLSEHDPTVPGCLVADYVMPGMNGLELQRRLAANGWERSIVFLSGHGDIPLTVRAMKAGAVSFLAKPAPAEKLVAAIHEALAKDAAARRSHSQRAAIEARLETLTRREREVLELVVAGKMNKQIAALLGMAEKTVKTHRGRVMHKMQVRSVAELVGSMSRATDSGEQQLARRQ